MKARQKGLLQSLRLAEGHIVVEQLRLIYGNVGSSVIPAWLLAILLVVTMLEDGNQVPLLLWCATVIALKLYTGVDARRRLGSDISFAQARRQVVALIVLHAVDGAAWGALAWIVLDGVMVPSTALAAGILTGILANSVAMLAPVLSVFVAYIAGMMILLLTKLWLMDDSAYNALGWAGVLYLISLLGQARNSALTVRATIEMRFENVGLMKLANEARIEAEQANLAKSKFLAAASHDLRQPIHAQGLFLEVLAHTDLTVHQREVLASARSASLASSEMLNTLLDFSRIEAGVVRPLVQPFDLQTLFYKIENDLAPQADAKGMVYRSRETALTVNSDATLVEMILRNLVSNAIRYTERGGVLTACRRRGNTAVVEVWDTGIGIEPIHQQDIFREFHQLGNPERDRHKGQGLGLAIADGLAKVLGHGLSLSSRPGRGSVFRLVLPLTRAAAIRNEPAFVHDAERLRGVHVLVIDDDEAILSGMAQLLHSWGCVCDTAGSISEALFLAQIQAPDIVISDYRLREQRTGAEAIAALRALLGEDLPALKITGDTAPDRLREAMARGVPLLHKPVSPNQLYRSLADLLGERNTNRPGRPGLTQLDTVADLAEKTV